MSAIRFRIVLMMAVLASVQASGSPKGTPGVSPFLHIRLGPDGNACGITVPSGKPKGKRGLIVWLHGGMRSPNREKGLEAHCALLKFVPLGAYYLCSPFECQGSEWPTPRGVAIMEALIAHMTSHYPIDSGNIDRVGVSDGGLGVVAYRLHSGRGT